MAIPNTGEQKILNLLTNNATTSDLYCKLFTNNLTVTEGCVLGDITEIVSGSGSYTPIRCTAGSWTISTSVNDTTSAAFPTITFNFTGAVGNVYGYYLTTTGPETLIQVNTFSAGAYNIQNNGDQISLNITLNLN